MEGRYDLLDDLKELYDELKQDVSLLSRTKTTANGSQAATTAATASTTSPTIALPDSSTPILLTTGDQGMEGQGGVVAATTSAVSIPPHDQSPSDPLPHDPPPSDPPPGDSLPPVDEPWAVKRKREKLEEQQRKDKEKNQQVAVLAALNSSNHPQTPNLPLLTDTAGGNGGSLGGAVAVAAPLTIALSQTRTKSPDKATRSSTVKAGQGPGQSQGGCFPSLMTSPFKLPLINSLMSLATNSKPEAVRTGPLIGCEITFTIMLTDDNREVLNLPDLEAIDLPLLLAKQVG